MAPAPDEVFGACIPTPGDTPCVVCIKIACCAALSACDSYATCVCLLVCAESGSSPAECNAMCGGAEDVCDLADCGVAQCGPACGG
jgi:hypothetical protein